MAIFREEDFGHLCVQNERHNVHLLGANSADFKLGKDRAELPNDAQKRVASFSYVMKWRTGRIIQVESETFQDR